MATSSSDILKDIAEEYRQIGGWACKCIGWGSDRFPDPPPSRRWVGYQAVHAIEDCKHCGGRGLGGPPVEYTPDPDMPF